MKKFRPFLIYLTLLLIAIVSFINIFFTFHAFNKADEKNNGLFSQLVGRSETNAEKIKASEQLINDIASKVAEIQQEQSKQDPQPVPKDGKDGSNGQNGKDGTNGEKGEKGDKGDKGDSVKGDTGANGLTPEFRCNIAKNRWEVRYGSDLGWEIPNNVPSKCTVTREDIIKALLSS